MDYYFSNTVLSYHLDFETLCLLKELLHVYLDIDLAYHSCIYL